MNLERDLVNDRCKDCIYRNDYVYKELTRLDVEEFGITWCSNYNEFALLSEFCDDFEWINEEEFVGLAEEHLEELELE